MCRLCLRTTLPRLHISLRARLSSWLCGILLVKKNTTDCDRFRTPRQIFFSFASPLTVPTPWRTSWTKYDPSTHSLTWLIWSSGIPKSFTSVPTLLSSSSAANRISAPSELASSSYAHKVSLPSPRSKANKSLVRWAPSTLNAVLRSRKVSMRSSSSLSTRPSKSRMKVMRSSPTQEAPR